MEESIVIDLHQHPMVPPEDFTQYWGYLRSDDYVWGYDAVREGGFTAALRPTAGPSIALPPESMSDKFPLPEGEG